MATEAVGIESLERAVVGRERALIELDEFQNQFAHRVGRRYCGIHAMTWSTMDIMNGLYTAVAVMLIVVLYHVLFIVVDLRKVMRRINVITEEVEMVIMKPLSMTDRALEWMIQYFSEKTEKHSHKKFTQKNI